MNIYFRAIALIALTVSLPANAVIVDGKDWLQVTDTVNHSWHDFDDVFDTSTGLYDGAGALLGGIGGVDVSAYTWATNSEVSDMFISYLGPPGLGSCDFNFSICTASYGVDDLDAFFANVFMATTESDIITSVHGFTRSAERAGFFDPAPLITARAIHIPGNNSPDDLMYFNGAFFNQGQTYDFVGGWIYRSAVVPIPAALWLFGTALIGLVGFSKRRKVT